MNFKLTPKDSTKSRVPLKPKFSITSVIDRFTKAATTLNIPYNDKIIDIKELSEEIGKCLREKRIPIYLSRFKNRNDYDLEHMSCPQLLSLNNQITEYQEYLDYCRINYIEEVEKYEKYFDYLRLKQLVEDHKRKANRQEFLYKRVLN